MKNIVKKTTLILALVAASFASLALLPSNSAYAADICSQAGISEEIKKANGCGGNPTEIEDSITGIVEAVIGIAGFIAVIYIVIGGVNYMTSGGDTGKIQKAKSTILYALIGLIICALAFAIVNWVIAI